MKPDILTPFLDDADVILYAGDCVEVMKRMPGSSVDAIVTDPPYGLEFMGKGWDGFGTPLGFQTWTEAWAVEAFRILKPGGHLLAFAGTRTYHRMASGVEDAGFEIRDCIAWMYGSGFPKSLDVSKAIDKRRDDLAEVYEVTAWVREARDSVGSSNLKIDRAFGFAGMANHWTSSKSQPTVPTLEQIPVLLDALGVSEGDVPERIRYLFSHLNQRKGTPGEAWMSREVTGQHETAAAAQGWKAKYGIEANLTAQERRDEPATHDATKWNGWGTALKPAFEPVVVARRPLIGTVAANVLEHGTGALNIDACRIKADDKTPVPAAGYGRHEGDNSYQLAGDPKFKTTGVDSSPGMRWPANIALDATAAAMLDEQSGERPTGQLLPSHKLKASDNRAMSGANQDRNPRQEFGGDTGGASRFFYTAKASRQDRNVGGLADNTHPTVKPTDLMRWLIRLVTPPGGIILDPFGGSGSTGLAARAENVRCILIEREPEYLQIIRDRLAQQNLFATETTTDAT
jgi:DNA modification methylase